MDEFEPADSGNSEPESTFDVEQSSDTLANDLFPKGDEPEVEAEPEVEPEVEPEAEPEAEPTETPSEVPKSWKKEMHESFSKLDPEVQNYIKLREQQMAEGLEKDRNDAVMGRTMRDTIQPFRRILEAEGVNEQQAVQHLLNAHVRLTQGTPEQRAAAYAELGRTLGLSNEPDTTDPQLKALREELSGIKNTLTQSQLASQQEVRNRVTKDVSAFASDPAHPYFDDVADDIIVMLQAGAELKDAYEKAVWANPITRQKEMARLQTEQEANFRKKASEEAAAAKKAKATNIHSRDTKRTPTGPKATMKDLDGVLNETMREIKSRT